MALAVIGIQVVCAKDGPGHVLTWHAGPLAAAALVGSRYGGGAALLDRRSHRWGAGRESLKLSEMRYRSADEDSARWDGFAFCPGDIVISTRSKSGTTWAQMICALLVFQDPRFAIEHGRRRILHFHVTDRPEAAWVVQQLRDAFPFDTAPRHLVFDRDATCSAHVISTVKSLDMKPSRTAPRSPWQNGATSIRVQHATMSAASHRPGQVEETPWLITWSIALDDSRDRVWTVVGWLDTRSRHADRVMAKDTPPAPGPRSCP